jgi:GYD domain-containing protein
VKDVYRTMGRYDLAAVVDAPDDVTISSLLYSTGALGNIRTETLRAFSREETEETTHLGRPARPGLSNSGRVGLPVPHPVKWCERGHL